MLIGDEKLQCAIAQLSENGVMELDRNYLLARLVKVARLHQAAPLYCLECRNTWPCATQQTIVAGVAA